MKKILLFSFGVFTLNFGITQTTAQDWTLTDCASNSHTLFNYLDGEEVVVMEFGMGCGSCYVAADGLYDLKLKYAVDQPGKVNFFYMDYWAGNTCSADVNPVLAASPLDAGFENCSSQLSYYMNGSPMPAVVIVAGSNHTVIYEKNSFAYADTTNMITAIDNFFATVGVIEMEKKNSISIYPNPSVDFITIHSNENGKIKVMDVSGKIIFEGESSNNNYQLDISTFSQGAYFVEMENENGVAREKFLKR